MKTLEELQREYDNAIIIKNNAISYFRNQEEELKEQVLKLSKYEIGQKVETKAGWNSDKIETGIIRYITTKERYSSKLCIRYMIGKITKSGAMHKVQNIDYSAIEENNIIKVIK